MTEIGSLIHRRKIVLFVIKLREGEASYPYSYSVSPDLKNCSSTSKALILTFTSSAFVSGWFKEMHLLTKKKDFDGLQKNGHQSLVQQRMGKKLIILGIHFLASGRRYKE